MTLQSPVESRSGSILFGLYGVIALLAAEVFLTVPLITSLVTFDCWQNWPAGICRPLFDAKASVYTLVPAFVLVAMLLSPERRALTREAGIRGLPLALNLAGLAVFLLPALWLRDGTGTRFMVPSFLAFGGGMVISGFGAALMLATPEAWAVMLRRRWGLLVACLAAGIAAPFLARSAQPLWDIRILSDATFHCVVWVLEAIGQEVTVDYPTRAIGDGTFVARIAALCSGLEGVALIAFFVTLYLALFRRELRFPLVLILYPLGFLASWLLNVLRIAVLILIGLNGDPELAQNGFHSHAGWLMFTLLALAIVLVARSVRAFAAEPVAAVARPPLPPFFADPAVARILPFAIFMASALLASTFATVPAVVYPLRALAMAAALLPFLGQLRALDWRLDPLALATGAGLGLIWAMTGEGPQAADLRLAAALHDLTTPLFLGWIVIRVVGTGLLVPVIEELFFRDHLLPRLAGERPAPWRLALAIVVTSAIFGALHGRWALAFVAGVLYAGLRWRSGRIGDAIQSHMASNLVIAAVALATDDWSLI